MSVSVEAARKKSELLKKSYDEGVKSGIVAGQFALADRLATYLNETLDADRLAGVLNILWNVMTDGESNESSTAGITSTTEAGKKSS
jgi:hypothetical protein